MNKWYVLTRSFQLINSSLRKFCSSSAVFYKVETNKHHFGFRRIAMGSVSSRRSSYNVQQTRSVAHEQNRQSSSGSLDEDFEQVVCSISDLAEESAKCFEVDGKKILLAKSEGSIYAVGSKCTHYGLPLENGSVCKGRIRCPFHGACFSLKTGDIEDFPGLDNIPKFDVEVIDGQVKVSGKKSLLEAKKVQKKLPVRNQEDQRMFIVIGGGAAGAKCVETLRQEGFSGRILMLTSEMALPYDRPKLSKALHVTANDIALRNLTFYQEAGIEVDLGSEVESVDFDSKEVKIRNGRSHTYDKLFIATGGTPRRLTVPGSELENVFVLRKSTDANEIVSKVKGKKVAVIGTSFIGMEAACYLSSNDRCISVTVLGTSSVPFERSLGSKIGGRIQEMFENEGVTIINNAQVAALQGGASVEKVVLNDGRTIEADAVIVGIGVVPATGFLTGAGQVALDGNGYVRVDEHMKTSVDGVYCGGDIAAFPLFLRPGGHLTSIGHWQMAHQHGHVAALNMVGKETKVRSVPFFWTALFGKSLRYTGYGSFDEVIISGDLDSLEFIAYYCQGDKVVAVASMGKAPAAPKYADYLYRGNFLTKEEVLQDGEVVLKLDSK